MSDAAKSELDNVIKAAREKCEWCNPPSTKDYNPITGDPEWWHVCGETKLHSYGAILTCTRPKDHDGQHVACGVLMHPMAQGMWDRDKNSAVEYSYFDIKNPVQVNGEVAEGFLDDMISDECHPDVDGLD